MSRILVIAVGKNIKNYKELTSSFKDYEVVYHSLILPMKEGVKNYVDRVVEDVTSGKLRIDGIVGLNDYSSLIAAIIARRIGLISPSIESLLNCQNKYLSREIQNKYLPNNTPGYLILSDKSLNTFFNFERGFAPPASLINHPRADSKLKKYATDFKKFPIFIKPVKGSLSFFSYKVESKEDLNKKIGQAEKVLPKKNKFYKKILAVAKVESSYVDNLLCEELIKGEQITIDGYVFNGKVVFFGITKSNFLPGTLSFSRFDYPYSFGSSLDSKIYFLAKKLVKAVGLNNSLFNAELMVDVKSKGVTQIKIVEINSRPSAQFMYMIYQVTGFHPLKVALDISIGKSSKFEARLQSSAQLTPARQVKSLPAEAGPKLLSLCSCFILRRKGDALVTRSPTKEEVRALEKKYAPVEINILASQGHKLSHYRQDTETFRYAEIKVPGKNIHEIEKKFEEIKKELIFEFRKIKGMIETLA